MATNERWVYPGGEVGVRVSDEPPSELFFRIQSSEDLMCLMMTLNAHAKQGHVVTKLFIPYLPYARQDRIVVPGDPQALEVLATMLAESGVSHVMTCDVHSQAAIGFFAMHGISLVSVHQRHYARQFWRLIVEHPDFHTKNIHIVIPDKGATDKATLFASAFGFPLIQIGKKRDSQTGKLQGFEVLDAPTNLPEESCYLLIDDICDGGGTFLGAMQAVRDHYARRYTDAYRLPSYLFTTHGIYSQGLDRLMTEFDSIGSTDSFLHGKIHPRLHVLSCNP